MSAETVCPVCTRPISPGDPRKFRIGEETLHRFCWDGLSTWTQSRIMEGFPCASLHSIWSARNATGK